MGTYLGLAGTFPPTVRMYFNILVDDGMRKKFIGKIGCHCVVELPKLMCMIGCGEAPCVLALGSVDVDAWDERRINFRIDALGM